MLEGAIAFRVGEETLTATAGMFANMPVGVAHSFKNESGATARMLISVAPAGPPPSHAEIERLLAAALRYGVEILAP